MPTGQFKTVPSKDMDPETYDDDETHWLYVESNGSPVVPRIRKINGQYYGFDANGKVLQGLYRIESEANGKTIQSAGKIEDMDETPNEDEDDVFVHCFGDSPKEGVMKTGTVTVEIDGGEYYYSFKKSGSKKGAGTGGINDDSIYVKGRRLEAEGGTKY